MGVGTGFVRTSTPIFHLAESGVPHRIPTFAAAGAVFGILALAHAAFAQESGYYSWLRAHLDETYGVSGGDWVLGSNEQAVLGLAQVTSGVDEDVISVSDQEFGSGRRYTVLQPTAETWHRSVRFHIAEPVADGDALLLAVWMRHVWPEDVVGRAELVFEAAASPYDKSLAESFSVPYNAWGLYLIPFEAVGTYDANGARFQIQLGFQRQMIELGGLALLNYGSDVAVSELPRVVPAQVAYGGHSPDAAWRAGARARIEQHRMGTFRVRIKDGDGEPVPAADVQIEMKRHAFGFGTAVNSGILIGPGRVADYRTRLADLTGDGRTFNIAVLENALKWPQWESNWPLSKDNKVIAVTWLYSRGMDVRGHNLVWPGWNWLPDDIETNSSDPAYISERIHDHIHEIAGYDGLKGIIRDWDVVNEPAHETDLRDVFVGTADYPTEEDLYKEWFDWAREADPEARLFVNDYSIISSYGPLPAARSYYKRIIRGLIEAGAPLDGIGVQGHMGNPLTPIDTVYKVIDELADFGRAISVTEYDASGVEEEIAGDYMRDFLTIVFSHPAVESFLMWGFWDGSHWRDDAPMFREDWSLKPSGQAFLDLVFDEWWTSLAVQTDEEGGWMGRGYAGTYEIAAATDDAMVTQEVQLNAADTVDVLLKLTSTANATDEAPTIFQVAPNFPEPASDQTRLGVTLGAPASVEIEIYDVLGRRVARSDEGHRSLGRHEIMLDVRDLPAGTYLYRLTAGKHTHAGTMSVLR